MDSCSIAENADLSSSTAVIGKAENSISTPGRPVRIGVLGGIGPEATGEFYNKLIRRLQERGLIKSNSDFPQIIINSIPAPELIRGTISARELQAYYDGLGLLDETGVDFIVMICNTIHLFYDELQAKIKTSIIDIRCEVKRALERAGAESVLMLGTPSTVKNGLYKFNGINYIVPTDEEIDMLSRSIFDFNRGIGSRVAADICRRHLRKADMVVLACTEFALMLDKEDIPKISTIDVMVDATISKFLYYRLQMSKEGD